MAETFTARFGLIIWGAPTDGPTRAEFNTLHQSIETLAAIDKQGTFAARPAPGVQGTYYADTTNGIVWRDNGSAWAGVGSRSQDTIMSASGTSAVPLTTLGVVGQTANLFEAKVDTTVFASISPSGNITGSALIGKRADLVNTVAADHVISGKGAASQSGDLLRLKDNLDNVMHRVTAAGAIESAYLKATSGAGVVGASSATNAANMSLFSGTPVFEARSTAGASASFTNFIYLKQAAVNGTATLRRLGLLMKVGDETVGDATKTGAVYIESSAANFTDPKLVLARADTPVLQFPATGFASIEQSFTVNGQLSVVPGANNSILMGNTRLGVQGDHIFLRSGSSAGVYFYAGGSYNSTPGNAGGGTQLGQLDSTGRFIAGKLTLTSVSDASLAQGSPTFMVGSASGLNLILDDSEIMARNNGAASTLSLQADGGTLSIGGPITWGASTGRVTDEEAASFVTTATSPTTAGGAICGVAFVAPPSGNVDIKFGADIQPSGSWAVVYPVVKSGSVVNSGADVAVPTDTDWLVAYGEGQSAGREWPVSGLTPGSSYNTVLYHYTHPSGNASISRRRVTVSPSL